MQSEWRALGQTDEIRFQSKKALYPLGWERRQRRELAKQKCQGEGADPHQDATEPSGKQDGGAPAESQGGRISHSHEAPWPGWAVTGLSTVIQQPGWVPSGTLSVLRRRASTWGAVWEASPAGLETAHTASAYTAPVRPNRTTTPDGSLQKSSSWVPRTGRKQVLMET